MAGVAFFIMGLLLGLMFSACAACVPGIHVYNLLDFYILLFGVPGSVNSEIALQAFFIASVTGYALLNVIPSVVFCAPDESAMLTTLPGQKLMRDGRGEEAVALSVCGGMLAIGGVLLILWFGFTSGALRLFVAVIRPHYHWMLWCAIIFMLCSEWPRYHGPALRARQRLALAWVPLLAGLVTFFLSGLLGFALFFGALLPVSAGFMTLLPAFLGLFAIPGLIMGLVTVDASSILHDEQVSTASAQREDHLLGVASGVAGGMLAAFLPAVTAGVGGLLAGHAAGVRGDRTFLVAQGASRAAYYVGGLCLLFVPGLHLRRGGAAHMLRSLMDPWSPAHFYRACVATLFTAVLCAALWRPLTRLALRLLARWGRRACSIVMLVLIVVLVVVMTGGVGLLVCATGTGIGLIPVLYGSRRTNALGVILLPVACGMSGVGGSVAAMLGLL